MVIIIGKTYYTIYDMNLFMEITCSVVANMLDWPSDGLVSYLGHSLGDVGSYPLAEVQSVYSTAPADWAIFRI